MAPLILQALPGNAEFSCLARRESLLSEGWTLPSCPRSKEAKQQRQTRINQDFPNGPRLCSSAPAPWAVRARPVRSRKAAELPAGPAAKGAAKPCGQAAANTHQTRGRSCRMRAPSGTSWVIHTLPPMTAPLPMVTRPRMVAPAYTVTLSQSMGCLGMPLVRVPSAFLGKDKAPRVTP